MQEITYYVYDSGGPNNCEILLWLRRRLHSLGLSTRSVATLLLFSSVSASRGRGVDHHLSFNLVRASVKKRITCCTSPIGIWGMKGCI